MNRILPLAVAAIAATAAIPGTAAAGGVAPFTEEAVSRGLVYPLQGWPQVHGYLGFGVAFVDLDDDGDEDVVLLGAADGHVGLFENDGAGLFTNRSSGSGLPILTAASAVAAGDVDGDGDLDLYLTQVGAANVLVLNDGDFTFTDVSVAAGVADAGAGKAATFADFDGDGWLDLYVANYNGIVPGTSEIDNKLFRNLGDGTFEDVSVAQTVGSDGYGFQTVWFDYDRDGDVDLYLSNDRGHLTTGGEPNEPNQLWRNDDGTLVNVSAGSGADVALFSMGVANGDFDGNRWPDLYCTNVGGSGATEGLPGEGPNPLLLNQGNGTFVEDSATWGVDEFITSWGSIFFDFDNDTHQDLYVNNMFVANSLHACDGSPPCVDVAVDCAVTGRFSNSEPSFSSAIADIDADGDLDLLVSTLGGNVELFINHEGETRNWIRFRMVDNGSNRFAVGGSIDTRVGSNWQWREILAGGNGYLGQNELVVHVGLDTASAVDEVVAGWPGGDVTRTLTGYAAGHTWTLYPPQMLGDADGNSLVELPDFVVFAGCFEEPLLPGCEIMDFTGDAAVLMNDFGAFLDAFDGEPADCNDNQVIDMREILLGEVPDDNNNGIPDACDPIFDDGFESGDTSAWSTVVP